MISIATLKDLYNDSLMRDELRESNKMLRTHVDDLVELNHDIVNFRVKLPENEQVKKTMKAIGNLDFSKFLR